MEKKKLIRIKARNSTSENYTHPNLHFAFVSDPTNGRIECTELIQCRETVNNILYLYRQKKSEYSSRFTKNSLIDFQKLHLLIVKDVEDSYDEFKTKLFSGKALLNRYEEKAGWFPTSKITTVKHPHYSDTWLLTGPKEWMSQPQLLSTVTFFMRLMSIHGPLEVDGTFEQAESSLKTLYKNYIKSKNYNATFTYYPDIEEYLGYLDDIKLLITNTKEIFEGIKLDDAWNKLKDKSSFSIYSGILSFLRNAPISYSNEISIAQNKFVQLKKMTRE